MLFNICVVADARRDLPIHTEDGPTEVA